VHVAITSVDVDRASNALDGNGVRLIGEHANQARLFRTNQIERQHVVNGG